MTRRALPTRSTATRVAVVAVAFAVPLALATGYLRIAADRHWATDVATGWAVGAAFGVGVPWLLHRTAAPTPTPVRRPPRRPPPPPAPPARALPPRQL